MEEPATWPPWAKNRFRVNLELSKLTLQQTAALLCISPRQLNNLVNAGVITRKGTGKKARYVWSQVFDAYLANKLAELGARNGHQDSKDQADAELRRTNADARLKELKADEMEGKLVDVTYVKVTQEQINSNVRNRLLAIPSKVTPQILGISSPARAKAVLEKEINQVCAELVKIAAKAPKTISEEEEEVYANG